MKKRIIAMLLLASVAAISLAGCGGSSSSGSSTSSENASSDESVAVEGIDAYSVTGNLTLGTGSSTGTFYYVGAAIGNAVSEAGKLNVLVQSTNGSNENVSMVQSGDIDLGMGNSDAIYSAYNGTMSYEEAGQQDIQEVAALYESQLHVFVSEKSGITDISELKGKKVCVGSQGTSYLYIDEAVLEAYGISLDDIEAYYMDYAEAAQALSDGDIDAAFQTGGYPIAGIQQYAANCSFRMLEVSQSVIDDIINKYPFARQTTIPAGTYENQANESDVATLTYQTCLFCSSKADDTQIYAFVKLMMEQLDKYQDTNDATRQISAETIATEYIPFNNGARAYYEEAGLLQ